MNSNMLITPLITLFVIQLLGVMMPGPDFFMVLRTALKAGRDSALVVTLGIASGVLTYSSIVVVFLDYLNDNFITATHWIGMFGGIYLLYMSYGCFNSSPSNNSNNEKTYNAGNKTYIKLYLTGLMCNLSNTKVIIIFLSVLPLFVIKSNSTIYHLCIIAIIFFSTIAWFATVSCIMGYQKIRLIFINQTPRLEKIFGIILIFFAIVLFYEFIIALH